MNYQGIVENIRALEDSFTNLDGGWPGHYGFAHSRYPNLAAELAVREWQIGTPVEAARVSRSVLAGVIEDGDELHDEELRSISNRMRISYRYLCSPVLSTVKPTTNKGRYRIAILRRLLIIADQRKVYCGKCHYNARITLACLERGNPVTYASWRWACQGIRTALKDQWQTEHTRHLIRTERIATAEAATKKI